MILLAAVVVAALDTSMDDSDTFESDGLTYRISDADAKEVIVAASDLASGDVVIPSTVEHDGMTYTVIDIDNLAFNENLDITSLTLPETLRDIRWNSIYGCVNISSVTVAEGNELFYDVDGVLYGYDGGLYLLYYPPAKEGRSFTVPDDVDYIFDYAISFNPYLEEVILGDNITRIYTHFLYECRNIRSADLPESVRSLGSYAYYGCEKITYMYIPARLTTIGAYPFQGCTSLEYIEVSEDNSTYYDADGVLMRFYTTSIVRYPPAMEGDVYEVPSDVMWILEGAFESSRLKEIVLTTEYMRLWEGTLAGLSVETITFRSMTRLSADVGDILEGSGSLETIVFEDGIADIEMENMDSLTSLSRVRFPYTLTSISAGWLQLVDSDGNAVEVTAENLAGRWIVRGEGSAFTVCDPPTETVFESGGNTYEITGQGTAIITSFLPAGEYAYVPGEVTYGDETYTVYAIGPRVLADPEWSGELTISGNVTSIAPDAFRDADITGLYFEGYVSLISSGAFAGCTGIQRLSFQELNNIASDAFEGITFTDFLGNELEMSYYGLEYLTFVGNGDGTLRAATPSEGDMLVYEGMAYRVRSVSDLEVSLAGFDEGNEEFSIPSDGVIVVNDLVFTIVTIESYSFDYEECGVWITGEIAIPGTVRYIGYYAFHEQGITGVWFGEGLETIDSSAFSGCLDLTGALVIPDSVSYIGEWAFSSTGITSLDLGDGIETLEDAFLGCEDLTGTVRIPASLTSIDAGAFFATDVTGFVVDPDNPVYFSEDGTIYAHDGFGGWVLVIIPPAYEGPFTIPAEVTGIESMGISMPGLEFTVEKGNEYFTVIDGILYNADVTDLYRASVSVSGRVTLPDTVENILDLAFYYRTEVTEVVLPEATRYIGSNAFSSCTSLRTINLSNVMSIDMSAFYLCTSLESVEIADNAYLYGSTFSGCESLETITFLGSLRFTFTPFDYDLCYHNGWRVETSALAGRTFVFNGTDMYVMQYYVDFELSGAPASVSAPDRLTVGYGTEVEVPMVGMSVDGYSLTVYIDGEEMSGLTFVMPDSDVTVTYSYVYTGSAEERPTDGE